MSKIRYNADIKLKASLSVLLLNWRLFIVLLSLLFLNQTLYSFAATERTSITIPEDSTKLLPLAPEQSISTFVPSVAAPGNGLAVNIIYPKKTRYKEGAPMVVVIAGGDTPSGLNLSIHGAQVGLIEVRFSFPGGGVGDFKSGGYNDYRGIKSQRALRDILLFAAGKGEDFRHRKITDLIPIKLCTSNIGIVGWSNGGNIALVTMEKYQSDLAFLRWLALYECPLGSLFFPPSLGSTHDFLSNSHYRQGSAATGHCLIDFRQLAWQADTYQNPGIRKKLGEPDLPGVIYFDDNKNGKWDETAEFAFNYCVDRGVKKKIYPPDITSAMERLQIFEGSGTGSTTTSSGQNAATNGADKSASISTTSTTSNTTGFSSTSSSVNSNIDKTSTNNNSTNNNKIQSKQPVDPIDKVYNFLVAARKLKNHIERTGITNIALQQGKPVNKATVKQKSQTDSDTTTEDKTGRKVARADWPSTVATLEESEAYFQERDGSLSIPAICSSYPNLSITIIANQVDHLQNQPDHPHIVLQYNALLDNGAHWLRLNPESIYLTSLANMNKSNFVQNEPNMAIEATDIQKYLEPAGALKDYVYVNAAIAELADRCQFKNLNSPLTEPLYQYDNGTAPVVAAGATTSKGKETNNKSQAN